MSIFWAANLSGQEKINWLTWEEAVQLNKLEKKKVMVDVYTDWCTWCKKMDTRTFQKANIATYVNNNYYAVKFNAEQKSDIVYKGKKYSYVAGFGKRGFHELAEEIMKGKMSYPTVVFLDEDMNVIQPIPGFQNARTFDMIIHFFAGNHYTTTPWHKFEQNYVPMPINTIQPMVQPVKNH